VLDRVKRECAANLRKILRVPEPRVREIAEEAISAIMAADECVMEIGHLSCVSTGRDVGEYWYAFDRELGTARLQYLFVAPEARGRGYGKGAIAAIHDALSVRGCNCVELNVLASNAAALALYRSCGYEVDSHEMICSLPSSAALKPD